MKYSDLEESVAEALRGRGINEYLLSKFSPERVFIEYCEWNGLIGWGPELIDVLDSLRSIKND